MQLYFLLEPAHAIQLILELKLAADGRVDGGDIIEAIGKGFDIEPGAADHDGGGASRERISALSTAAPVLRRRRH
jgi:hypothetical protein